MLTETAPIVCSAFNRSLKPRKEGAMLVATNLITQVCEGLPSVADGVQALRDCTPQTGLRSSFGLTPEKAHSVGSIMTLAAMSMVVVILFLIMTGRMSIGGLFRSVTSTRQLDKMYTPKVEKAVEPSSEEPKVQPSAEETTTEEEDEVNTILIEKLL